VAPAVGPEPAFTPAPAPFFAAAPAPLAGVGAGAPVTAPVPTVDLVAPPVSGATTQAVAPAATGVPLTTAVSSAYGIVIFGVIGTALLVSFLAGLTPASPSAPAPGGTVRTQRTRLWTGLAVIAVAAVVGGIGWYRVSGEPLLNRQIPYLAGAGIAVVVLAVLGGALVVAEQLRADQHRIGELESAVRALTDALSPLVEQPARRTGSDALVQ